MNQDNLTRALSMVAKGTLSVDKAVKQLETLSFENIDFVVVYTRCRLACRVLNLTNDCVPNMLHNNKDMFKKKLSVKTSAVRATQIVLDWVHPTVHFINTCTASHSYDKYIK